MALETMTPNLDSASSTLDKPNTNPPAKSDPLAVCGIGLRLPGGIRNTRDFWDLLVNGKDAIGPVPETRYNVNGFNDSLGAKGALKSAVGYFLDEDLTRLDTSFFSMTKKEVEICDPQQRQLLEITREALDDAGEIAYRGEDIGCYVGTFGEGWSQIGIEDGHYPGGYIVAGKDDIMLSNRVSYEYDLKGPSMTIKTGCSASLVALHEASRAIERGDATAAIVAGTSLILSPKGTAAFTSTGVLSSDTSCKTFDASADGYARAESITAIFVKPLSTALRDGNTVRAIIRGTGVNSDGKSHGLLNPNSLAQEALIRKVYSDAQLQPSDTAFIECHGTGTIAGDVAETTAVGSIFGERGIWIGSVKPNIGHGEGSSGLNSLIKAVLALEHGIIPPNIKFSEPNPNIPFSEKRLKVPVVPTPFPRDCAERVSVNSFGIGGTNAHAIVDSYKYHTPTLIGHAPRIAAPELILFSANTTFSLGRQIEDYSKFLTSNVDLKAADVAFTLATKRENLPYRGYAILQDKVYIDTQEATQPCKNSPNLYFIFNGQGSQWARMGGRLVETDPLFKADLEAMEVVLRGLNERPAWSLQDELMRSSDASRIDEPELSQPLSTAVQLALVNRLARHGVVPDAVVGHSSGEIAAAYALGAISVADAITVAYYRGMIAKQNTHNGAMAAIGLGRQDVSKFITDGVVIGCENSPSSTTLSGDRHILLGIISKIKEEMPDVLARLLKVDVAYHSYQMHDSSKVYKMLLGTELEGYGNHDDEMKCKFFSSLTGKIEDRSAIADPEYWVRNLISPVQFSLAVEELFAEMGDGVLMEIGPHSTLAGPLRQICAHTSQPYRYASSLLREEDDIKSFASSLGRLHIEGVLLDSNKLYPGSKVVKELPPYPWDHSESFWNEDRVSQLWRFRKFPHHCLLGSRIPESPDNAPQWRNMLSLDEEPWIAEHEVAQTVVLPFAAYLAIAGEAVRQLTGVETGYGIKHSIVYTPPVLTESRPLEIITSLTPHRLTDSIDSEWFDFIISSYSSGNWVKNCQGQVKAISDMPLKTTEPHILPRQVKSSTLYDCIADVGINFGPEFQRLQKIRSATRDKIASANIMAVTCEQRKGFTMHPLEMDACFQLLMVAGAKGLGRNIATLKIPTVIERLDVFCPSGELYALAWGSSGSRKDSVQCYSDGKLVLSMSEMKLAPLDNTGVTSSDVHAPARLEWLPDLDLVDNIATLIKPPHFERQRVCSLEEMSLLCIIDSYQRLKDLESVQPHFEKLRNWMKKIVRGDKPCSKILTPDFARYLDLTPKERESLIYNRYEFLMDTAGHCHATALKLVWENCERFFTGEAQAIDVLMQDGILAGVYSTTSFDYSDFVGLMSVSKPTLRILEVGAGTGGTTELILQKLTHPGALPQFSKYTFTDITPGFCAQAQEIFERIPNMEYKVFDISKDPLQQGFDLSTYDLIIAANVVHATPSLKDSLQHLNMLLRPGGTLLLMELCGELQSPGYIFGNFSGWWVGEADGRVDEPFVPPSRWHEELLATGFSGADHVVYDDDPPYRNGVTIISRRISEVTSRAQVSLVVSDFEDESTNALVSTLSQAGFVVTLQEMGDEIPADHDVLVSVDFRRPFFEAIGEEDFHSFQKFVLHLDTKQTILWLTGPTQLKCNNPRYAEAIGAARAIRAELGFCFHTLEISETEKAFPELVVKLFRKIQQEQDVEGLISDKEFAVENGSICISRFQPFSLQNEVSAMSISTQRTSKTLAIGKIGMIDTIHWLEKVLPSLTSDEVEFKPKFIGLNLRDVLLAMGMIEQEEKGSFGFGFGFECTGVITAVGSDVKSFRVGDNVIIMALNGVLATKTTISQDFVLKVPERLTLQEAATVPLVMLTAWHCLVNLGRLKQGQSVLIHSACGGVGLAAIQVCKLVGADIYATVGTEEKIKLLQDKFGIPRSRIFNSRDESFLQGIMEESGNRGVDVVLNSLSGNLLHASWECVAKFGTMVEIGKRDLVGSGQLSLLPFDGSRQYAAFNGALFGRERQSDFITVANEFLPLLEQGKLGPLPYMTCFDAHNIVDAFRYLQNGKHIGKVLVSMPDDEAAIPSTPSKEPISFDPKATYLLTGGFGGLGRSMATWMIEHGARSLTFLSRSAGSNEKNRAMIDELESMNCHITAVSGAVENMADVKTAILSSPTPIKGVFHLAMVLSDCTMLDMTWEQWTEVTRPKVQGAWNLHHALADQRLDFFWLASSMVTVADQIGQGNYGAANAFLEAFCQYRLGLGLPTAVLSICHIERVGFVAENATALQKARMHSVYSLGEREYLDFVEHSIFASRLGQEANDLQSAPGCLPQSPWKNMGHIFMGLTSKMHLDDPRNKTTWRLDRRMGHYHNRNKDEDDERGGDWSELRDFLRRASENTTILVQQESIEFLAQAIGEKVVQLMLRSGAEVDVRLTLAQLGVDSLMATELRRWFRQALGLQVTVLELMAPAPLIQLAEGVSERLQAKYNQAS